MSEQTVRGTTFTTPSDRELVAVRTFEAPRERIWDAHVEPADVRRWMLGPDGWSMPVCDIDLRPNGSWRFRWRQDDGDEFEMGGRYVEISRPGRLVYTEKFADWPEALNTLVLDERDGRTTLTATVRYRSPEARQTALDTGMLDGWAQSYERLDELLRSGT